MNSSSAEANPNPAQHPFEPELLQIAKEYLSWGRIDDEDRWAPPACNTFATSQAPPGRAHVSESSDQGTHGLKLYSLFARNRNDYLMVTAVAAVPVGQAIVKQSWIPEEVTTTKECPESEGPVDFQKVITTRLPHPDSTNEQQDPKSDRFYPYAWKNGKVFKASEQADLFIMMKLDPNTPGTDEGWVYGTVTPDGGAVTSSGKIESCMKCHMDAQGDRLFGLSAYRQGAALLELERLGCRFTIHYEGEDPKEDLAYVVIKNKEGIRVADRHLVLLKHVGELKQLRLDYSQVTDAGMNHLAGVSRLKELGLSHTHIGDAGLAKLTGLSSLERLDLRATRVTDAGLANLRDLSTLKELRLGATQVTDAGRAELQQVLPLCQITDAYP